MNQALTNDSAYGELRYNVSTARFKYRDDGELIFEVDSEIDPDPGNHQYSKDFANERAEDPEAGIGFPYRAHFHLHVKHSDPIKSGDIFEGIPSTNDYLLPYADAYFGHHEDCICIRILVVEKLDEKLFRCLFENYETRACYELWDKSVDELSSVTVDQLIGDGSPSFSGELIFTRDG